MTDTFSFTAAIRGVAADMGRAPTPEQVDDLDDALRSIVHRDDAGEFIVTAGEREIPLVSYLRMQAAHYARATTDGSSNAPSRSQADRDADAGILRIGSSVQHCRQRGDFMADLARGFQASGRAAAAREAASHGNPWIEATLNRTRQQILKNNDPALAARMQHEAGR